jgi:hypothetical protein
MQSMAYVYEICAHNSEIWLFPNLLTPNYKVGDIIGSLRVLENYGGEIW